MGVWGDCRPKCLGPWIIRHTEYRVDCMTILDKILETKRKEVAAARVRTPVGELDQQVRMSRTPRDFAGALRRRPGDPLPNVIAELKKASPSKGLIRADFAVAPLARELAEAGAAALSVLTDERYFQGSLENLRLAGKAVSIPILRKDFIIDEYQVLEARANGADAILLIAAALDQARFQDLLQAALSLGLSVLAEVHDEAELDRVLATGAPVVGVNSRDLKTFAVDLATNARILGRIPTGRMRVAESGVNSRQDIEMLSAAGADAFLVGEFLMRHERPGRALQALAGPRVGST